jgi:hypothetical protein
MRLRYQGIGAFCSKCLGIAPEKLFESQRVFAGHDADRICDVVAFLASGDSRSEVLRKVRKVIECVWIEPVLHRFGPLFICDLDIADRSVEHSAKRFDDLVHGGNLANQLIRSS